MFYLRWPEKPTAFLEVCFYAFYDCPEIYLFVRNDAPEKKTGCIKQQDLTVFNSISAPNMRVSSIHVSYVIKNLLFQEIFVCI